MEVDDIGVHRTHCCKTHGCKYRDEDCPVESGQIRQDYDCEDNSPDSPCFPSPKPSSIKVEVIDQYTPKEKIIVCYEDNNEINFELEDEGKTLKIFIQKK